MSAALAAPVGAIQWASREGAGGLADAIPDRRAFLPANAINFLANVAVFAVWLLVPLERRSDHGVR